jgi:hypothetical protein
MILDEIEVDQERGIERETGPGIEKIIAGERDSEQQARIGITHVEASHLLSFW